MTYPGQDPAPFGYLSMGQPSGNIEQTRDDMILRFHAHTRKHHEAKAYYESQRRPEAVGMSVPKEMQRLMSHVGYPRLFVDAISDRLELEGFRLGDADDADDELWGWWQANNLDIESPLGHTDALVYGASYITIAAPDPDLDLTWNADTPIICVEPPTQLYAAMDGRTRSVMQAIRFVREDEHNFLNEAATLYLANRTISWNKIEGQWIVYQDVKHDLGVVPVVPITNRISIADLYGTSQITPEIRSLTDAASRILMDMQGAAELMAVPQRLLFGVKPEDIGIDPTTGLGGYDAYMARILAFADPEGKAFQFAAAELRNFGDALDQLDRKAAAYTGLPPQYLSVSSENPASAEAIEASESRFVKMCERKDLLFGGAWECAMRIAYRVMNPGEKLPQQYQRLESIWRDPSTPTYAAKAAAATQLYAGGLGVIPKKQARLDMGYSLIQIEQMEQWDEAENPVGLLGSVIGQGAAGAPGQAAKATSIAATPTETVDQTRPS